MKRNWLRGAGGLLWLAALLATTAGAAAQERQHVDVLQIEGAVTPIMISYIERGVRAAREDGAEALIVRLNTPGGQLDLMNKVVSVLLEADVPVVIYVSPRGAYAASAGTVIALAGHLVAMAPGTTIGAASPVGSEGEDLDETMESKVKEDMKALVRGLAERRGAEAVAWSESAIEEAKTASAQEALDLGVIDFIAGDVEDLLRQMDGQQVTVRDEQVTLQVAGAQVRELPMTFVEQFLHTITNPTIAFLLLSLGPTALMFELSSPGGYAAGVFGAICLLLGFYAVGVLPVNYAGLALILLAFALFLVDIKAPTHGVLTAGGISSLVAGGLILFNSPLYRVSVVVVLAVALSIGLFFAFAVAKAARAQRWPMASGREALIGAPGRARTALEPEGMVLVQGELWQATAADAPIAPGERVVVVGMDGLKLKVQAAAPDEER